MINGQPERGYTGDYLAQPGRVESLVAEGRVPRIDEVGPNKVVNLKLYGVIFETSVPDKSSQQFVCTLPPEGSRPGDTVRLSGLHGFLFYSPESVLRGTAELFDVTPEQAQDIKARTKVALAAKP